MKFRNAVKQAFAAFRAQLPAMLLFSLVQVVLRLMVLSPLLLLFVKQTAPFALLCVPLFVLIVLPARQNAAQCMQLALAGGSIFDIAQVSFADYGKKLCRGLKMAVLLLLWAAPAIAATAWAVDLYTAEGVQGKNDAATLLLQINQLGGGDIKRGLVYLAGIYAATFVPLLIGTAFHSGTRHAFALGSRSVLKEHRGGVMLCWFGSLLVYLPFAAVVGVSLGIYVPMVVQKVMSTFSFSGLPSPVPYLVAIGIGAVLLLLPALPIHGLLQAAYVRQLRGAAEERA